MNMPVTAADVAQAERLLAAGEIGQAEPLLEHLVEEIEDYAATELVATEKTQYFSFEEPFERIAYRRVENDPRTLVNVDVPLDRVYADLAYALIRQERYEEAGKVLAQAVRWNPMKCSYRLDLAELRRAAGDTQEWLALSHSVMERASNARELARAYVNFGTWFITEAKPEAAVACQRIAQGLAPSDRAVQAFAEQMAQVAPDAAQVSDDAALAALAEEGVPAGANAEICICLLMCASDALDAGNANQAASLTVRARNLIGEEACRALIKLIRESDAELAAERGAASQGQGDKVASGAAEGRGTAAAAGAAGSAEAGAGADAGSDTDKGEGGAHGA